MGEERGRTWTENVFHQEREAREKRKTTLSLYFIFFLLFIYFLYRKSYFSLI